MDLISLFEKMNNFYITYTMVLEQYIPYYTIVFSAIGLYLILYIFEGIGLYTMAEKQGISGKWQAFVPLANTYLLGRLAGECSFSGKKIKKIHVWLLLSEIFAFLIGLTWIVFEFLVLGTDKLSTAIDYVNIEAYSGLGLPYHFKNGWEIFNNIMPLILELFDIVFFVLLLIALISLFRKYSARSAMMITAWCLVAEVFFGLSIYGIFIFAMRNNKAVNYSDYIRKKQAEFIRSQQNRNMNDPYRYYSNKMNNDNFGDYGKKYNFDPYTGQPLHHDNKKEEPPFSEFGSPEKDKNDKDNTPFSF